MSHLHFIARCAWVVWAVALFPTVQAGPVLERIKASGTVVIAHRESSVPFSFVGPEGKPIGYAVDLCLRVVDALRKQLALPDLKTKFLMVTPANRIAAVEEGKADLECGSTTNNTARGKDVAFAINHFYTGTRLLVKKGSGIKDYADLAGKNVATTTGTTNLQVLRKYSTEKNLNFNMLFGKDHADSFLLVESGRALAFGMDDILLFGLKANAKNPDEFEVVGESLQVEPYACMLRKDDTGFKHLVDGVIGGMMKSGEFEKLYTKWFMQPIPPRGVPLGLPMSPQLKDNLKALSDKPAV